MALYQGTVVFPLNFLCMHGLMELIISEQFSVIKRMSEQTFSYGSTIRPIFHTTGKNTNKTRYQGFGSDHLEKCGCGSGSDILQNETTIL